MNPKKQKPCEMKEEGCKITVKKYNSLQPNICSNLKCIIAYSKTPAGQKRVVKAFKVERDNKTKELKAKKPEVKRTENIQFLQKEINLLARMIDEKFGYKTCIDCNEIMDKQIHGAHFNDVGAHDQLRFNLHNIHSALSQCNRFSNNHKTGYSKGLLERYGIAYLNKVEYLPLEYKSIKLSGLEVVNALKITRAIIRSFDTYKFDNAIEAREVLNKIIGMYK